MAMKRFLLASMLLPQFVFSQYNSEIFKLNTNRGSINRTQLGQTIREETVLPIDIRQQICGLSISGQATLENDEESFIRVILKDDHNYEHLVYETYPMLSEGMTMPLDNIGMETVALVGVTPQSIRVELKNATLRLDSYNTISERNAPQTEIYPEEIHRQQTSYIVSLLNRNLESHHKTWRARVTSISEKTYEDKKAMFGGKVPQMYGFEHYSDGYFVIPGYNAEKERMRSATKASSTTPTYVSSWDWRNRHGKNWLTSVKYQGDCNSCYAFATVAALESHFNLYYNRIIPNNNLSEQEIVTYSNNHGCDSGGVVNSMLYIKQNGIVKEICFPYAAVTVPNYQMCENPTERINITNYSYRNRDSLVMKELFKHPITLHIAPWWHIMLMAGYKTISVGDIIYNGNDASGKHKRDTISSTNHSNLIGERAWLAKNSWSNWGSGGFGYIVAGFSNIHNPYFFTGKVTSQTYNDSHVVCEDKDGDGYYFWGLGDKQSSWPSWIPDSIDGDDNNYTRGVLYLNSPKVIGETEIITPNGISTLTINSNTTYTTRQYKRSHIVVASNKTLTVKNILNMFGRPTITIQSGGHLVIDGGTITNTKISMVSGSKLTIKNGGKLVMRTNTDFIAPTGAIVEMTNGEILRSNDF